jgi:hypothetical protein
MAFAAELVIQTVLACLQPFGFAGFFGKGPLPALILRRDGGIDGLAGDGADGVGGGFGGDSCWISARAAFTSKVMTTVMVAREERMSFMVGREKAAGGLRPSLKVHPPCINAPILRTNEPFMAAMSWRWLAES